ncbi:MAG: DUF5320 domain-containing protein [Eubacteriales bacterium]|nr:DUF5320 domain-containing protein [Eubacteriales bacterium]
MPGRNGTGPAGAGAGTGKGRGGCVGATASEQRSIDGNGRQHGAGRGRMQGRGFGRGFAHMTQATTQKDALEQQRDALQTKLNQVEEQLKSL